MYHINQKSSFSCTERLGHATVLKNGERRIDSQRYIAISFFLLKNTRRRPCFPSRQEGALSSLRNQNVFLNGTCSRPINQCVVESSTIARLADMEENRRTMGTKSWSTKATGCQERDKKGSHTIWFRLLEAFWNVPNVKEREEKRREGVKCVSGGTQGPSDTDKTQTRKKKRIESKEEEEEASAGSACFTTSSNEDFWGGGSGDPTRSKRKS